MLGSHCTAPSPVLHQTARKKNKRERNTFVCEEGNHICFVPYCTLILWGEMQNIPNIICRTIKHKQASTFVFAFTQRWKWENIKTRSLWFISELYSDIWLKHSMLLWQVTRIRAWNTQQRLQHKKKNGGGWTFKKYGWWLNKSDFKIMTLKTNSQCWILVN